MPVISDVVRDSSGALASRFVRLHRRDTGAVLGEALSDPVTGAYSIATAYAGETYVLAFDTASGDPKWGNVSLALRFNGTNGSKTFTDLKGHTVTVSGAAEISTAQYKFGVSSAWFPGTTAYALLDGSADFAFGTGDFYIRKWIRPTNTGAQVLIDFRPGAGNGFYPYLDLSGTNTLGYYVNSAYRITGTTAVTTGAWHYIELTRVSGVTRLFLDGVQQGSSWTDSTSMLVGASRPAIATNGSAPGSNSYVGYYGELEIGKGIPGNTANYTPPSTAFLALLTGGTENLVGLDRLVPV